MIGKVKGILYKPPQTKIRVFDSNDLNISYHFIPSSWENGVLINPIILSSNAVNDAKLKRDWNTANEVSFIISPADDGYYNEELTVTLYKVLPDQGFSNKPD